MTDFTNVDLQNPTTGMTVLNQTDRHLSVLRDNYNYVPDTSTTEGFEAVKDAVKKLTKYRTSLEKERKAWKAPFLEAGKKIDSEAKRITAELLEIEAPFKQAKIEKEKALELAKEKRLNDIRVKIQWITDHVMNSIGKTSEEIQASIQAVGETDTIEGFYELTDEAVQARLTTLSTLETMYNQAKNAEIQQKELLESRAKLKEAEAIADEATAKVDLYEGNEPEPMMQPAPQPKPVPRNIIPVSNKKDNVVAWGIKHDIDESAISELMAILEF